VSVVLSIEETGPSRKQLKVEVPGPAVDAEMQRVVEEFRRRAKFPGFRKGKAPQDLVKQRFRKDIEQEVVERLIPRYWRQAEAEAELKPMLPPNIDEVDFQPGEPLTFVASVEIRPEIELGDFEAKDLPEPETEPSGQEVERALEEMRRAAGEWVAVDRAAAQGDLVAGRLSELNADSADRAEPVPFSFEVGDPQIWEELSLEVTGKSAGQESEFTRKEAANEGEPPQSRRFRVEVQSVKERELPEMNDELAARLGDFKDVESLQRGITDQLRKGKEAERRQQREKALLDQLREQHPLTLPEGVVNGEIESMLRDYAQNLAGQGVDLEEAKVDWQSLAEQVRPQAEQRVHSRLLLDAVADRYDLKVEEGEFESTLAMIARAQRQSTVSVRQALDKSGRLTGLRAQLRREKAVKWLLGEAPAATDGGQQAGDQQVTKESS
jgi:trigger factor